MFRNCFSSKNVCKLILLFLPALAACADFYEGSPCRLHTNEMGVCKRSHKCKWLIHNLKRNQIDFNDIKRCSFTEQSEDVVCCGDEHPKEIKEDPCISGFVLEGANIDCMRTRPATTTKLPSTTQTPTTNRTPHTTRAPSTTQPPIRTTRNPTTTTPVPSTMQPKMLGSKIEAACSNYSLLAKHYYPDRIINGYDVGMTEFPHMVALGYPNGDNDYDFDCGGTLISDQWVLTAAHCIKDTHRPTIIRMGKIYLHSDDDGVDAVDRSIVKIVRHPLHSFIRRKNDIALIKLNNSVEFNDNVRPACMGISTTDVPETQELIIAGWGSIEVGRTNRSEILLKSNVTSLSLAECNKTLLKYHRQALMTERSLSESQMCAIDLQRYSSSCYGDSGGPIFTYNISGVSTIVGIVSFGIGCGYALPSVFTRVASYVDWIENTVWP